MKWWGRHKCVALGGLRLWPWRQVPWQHVPYGVLPFLATIGFDLRDIWVGVYWRLERCQHVGHGWRRCGQPTYFHVYICPLPMLVLHLRWARSCERFTLWDRQDQGLVGALYTLAHPYSTEWAWTPSYTTLTRRLKLPTKERLPLAR